MSRNKEKAAISTRKALTEKLGVTAQYLLFLQKGEVTKRRPSDATVG